MQTSAYTLTLHRAARGRGRVIGATLRAPSGETLTFNEDDVARAISTAREEECADPYDGGKLPRDETLIRKLLGDD